MLKKLINNINKMSQHNLQNEISNDKESLNRVLHFLKLNNNESGYDSWCKNYEKDVSNSGYICPNVVCEALKDTLITDKNQEYKILDVAVGTGINGKLLQAENVKVDGVDRSEGMMSIAKEKNIYQNLYYMDCNKPLEFEDNKYDGIICSGGFSKNQIRAQPAIKEFARLIKKDGIISFTTRSDELEYTDEVNNLVSNNQLKIINIHKFYGMKDKDVNHNLFILKGV